MRKLPFRPFLLGCILFTAIAAIGQTPVRKRVAARFGGECTGTSYSLSSELKQKIDALRAKFDRPCSGDFCNSAFAHDLNGDGRKEYFVRLKCGATGNCTYGIFSDQPAVLRGTFTAWYFFIDKRVGRWSTISTYTREGGDQGVIANLAYRRKSYVQRSERTERFYGSQEPYYVLMGLPTCP